MDLSVQIGPVKLVTMLSCQGLQVLTCLRNPCPFRIDMNHSGNLGNHPEASIPKKIAEGANIVKGMKRTGRSLKNLSNTTERTTARRANKRTTREIITRRGNRIRCNVAMMHHRRFTGMGEFHALPLLSMRAIRPLTEFNRRGATHIRNGE